ncbi:MAG: hypothetical protein AB1722_06805 [Pseudomonadota bacterium]
MKHLLVDISAHGYGHAAQTAPVLNRLAQLQPALRITVRSAVPEAYLRQRITCAFAYQAVAHDFGMHMLDALRVDVARSLQAYRAFHADWAHQVAQAAQAMRALQPDLLLANVPYLSLAAAHAAGVPAVAMCSLNWADIYRYYAPQDEASAAIHAQMLAAYGSARDFLKLQPAMPMNDLRNGREVESVVQLGTPQRARLRGACAAAPGERLVLVAMGGIAHRLPMESWPMLAGVRWLVPEAWAVQRADVVALESLGMPFRDVLASCDAVLTKPGYGTFVEAVCGGVPILYLPRADWPETRWLVAWAARHGVVQQVLPETLATAGAAASLHALWAAARPPLPPAQGVQAVAAHLGNLLRLG